MDQQVQKDGVFKVELESLIRYFLVEVKTTK